MIHSKPSVKPARATN